MSSLFQLRRVVGADVGEDTTSTTSSTAGRPRRTRKVFEALKKVVLLGRSKTSRSTSRSSAIMKSKGPVSRMTRGRPEQPQLASLCLSAAAAFALLCSVFVPEHNDPAVLFVRLAAGFSVTSLNKKKTSSTSRIGSTTRTGKIKKIRQNNRKNSFGNNKKSSMLGQVQGENQKQAQSSKIKNRIRAATNSGGRSSGSSPAAGHAVRRRGAGDPVASTFEEKAAADPRIDFLDDELQEGTRSGKEERGQDEEHLQHDPTSTSMLEEGKTSHATAAAAAAGEPPLLGLTTSCCGTDKEQEENKVDLTTSTSRTSNGRHQPNSESVHAVPPTSGGRGEQDHEKSDRTSTALATVKKMKRTPAQQPPVASQLKMSSNSVLSVDRTGLGHCAGERNIPNTSPRTATDLGELYQVKGPAYKWCSPPSGSRCEYHFADNAVTDEDYAFPFPSDVSASKCYYRRGPYKGKQADLDHGVEECRHLCDHIEGCTFYAAEYMESEEEGWVDGEEERYQCHFYAIKKPEYYNNPSNAAKCKPTPHSWINDYHTGTGIYAYPVFIFQCVAGQPNQSLVICQCANGEKNEDAESCPAHLAQNCESCDESKWRKRQNWPQTGHTSCWPKCGSNSNQLCHQKEGSNGSNGYYIPSPDETYCADDVPYTYNDGSWPFTQCRDSCCRRGCKKPVAGVLNKLQGSISNSNWQSRLRAVNWLPGMTEGAANAISGVSCKDEWDPNYPAEFYCETAGEPLKMKGCDQKTCECPNGNPDASACDKHGDIQCASCTDSNRWILRTDNWPAVGQKGCFPKCGASNALGCPKKNANGVHFIPTSNPDELCTNVADSDARTLNFDPAAKCRETCCKQGCKVPSSAALGKLNRGAGWGNWKTELVTEKFTPGMTMAGAKTISGVACNPEWDPSSPAKFYCENPGQPLQLKGCDQKTCRCPHGTLDEGACDKHGDIQCASCTAPNKWTLRNNWPAPGQKGCFPKCGTSAYQNCAALGAGSGIHYIASDSGTLCEGIDDSNALDEDQSLDPKTACQTSCCRQGCMVPSAADLAKLNRDANWNKWGIELIQQKFLPGSGAKSISGVSCNGDWDQSSQPKFYCDSPGEALKMTGCDVKTCSCPNGAVDSGSCAAHGQIQCQSCGDPAKWTLRNNWPSVGEKGCFPICGDASNQDCAQPDGNSVYFIPTTPAETYCPGVSNTVALINGQYPTDTCHDHCCRQGCKNPGSAALAKLGDNLGTGFDWTSYLTSENALPRGDFAFVQRGIEKPSGEGFISAPWNTCDSTGDTPLAVSKLTDRFPVRCCGDEDLVASGAFVSSKSIVNPRDTNTRVDCKTPAGPDGSQMCKADWAVSELYTYEDAVQLCENTGNRRLCTPEELMTKREDQNFLCQGTGGGCDNGCIWTATTPITVIGAQCRTGAFTGAAPTFFCDNPGEEMRMEGCELQVVDCVGAWDFATDADLIEQQCEGNGETLTRFHTQTTPAENGGAECEHHDGKDIMVQCPLYSCRCDNGEPETGSACAADGSTVWCLEWKCYDGNHAVVLNGTTRCEVNQCRCDHGIAATGVNCTADGLTVGCVDCSKMTGYRTTPSSDGQTQQCILMQCSCPDGRGPPKTGEECAPGDGSVQKCESCTAVGFHLDEATELCVANVCTCSHGTAANGTACTSHDAEICTSCDVSGGFHLEDYTANDGTTSNKMCVANNCTCSEAGGSPAVGAECTTHNAEICAVTSTPTSSTSATSANVGGDETSTTTTTTTATSSATGNSTQDRHLLDDEKVEEIKFTNDTTDETTTETTTETSGGLSAGVVGAVVGVLFLILAVLAVWFFVLRTDKDEKDVAPQATATPPAQDTTPGKTPPRKSSDLRFEFEPVNNALLDAGLTAAYAGQLAHQICDEDVEDDDVLAKPTDARDSLIMRRLGLEFLDEDPERVGRLRGFLLNVAKQQRKKSILNHDEGGQQTRMSAAANAQAGSTVVHLHRGTGTSGTTATGLGADFSEQTIKSHMTTSTGGTEVDQELGQQGNDHDEQAMTLNLDETKQKLAEEGFSPRAAEFLAGKLAERAAAMEHQMGGGGPARRSQGTTHSGVSNATAGYLRASNETVAMQENSAGEEQAGGAGPSMKRNKEQLTPAARLAQLMKISPEDLEEWDWEMHVEQADKEKMVEMMEKFGDAEYLQRFGNFLVPAHTTKKKKNRHSTRVINFNLRAFAEVEDLTFGDTEAVNALANFVAVMPPKKRFERKHDNKDHSQRMSTASTSHATKIQPGDGNLLPQQEHGQHQQDEQRGGSFARRSSIDKKALASGILGSGKNFLGNNSPKNSPMMFPNLDEKDLETGSFDSGGDHQHETSPVESVLPSAVGAYHVSKPPLVSSAVSESSEDSGGEEAETSGDLEGQTTPGGTIVRKKKKIVKKKKATGTTTAGTSPPAAGATTSSKPTKIPSSLPFPLPHKKTAGGASPAGTSVASSGSETEGGAASTGEASKKEMKAAGAAGQPHHKKKSTTAASTTKVDKKHFDAETENLVHQATEALVDVGFKKQHATKIAEKIAGKTAAELGEKALALTEEEKKIAAAGLAGATVNDLQDLAEELVAQKAAFFAKQLSPESQAQAAKSKAVGQPLSLLGEKCASPGKPKAKRKAKAKHKAKGKEGEVSTGEEEGHLRDEEIFSFA
ncbi:unnamed protein product [Amoebophrya sp. A120]|nr:unnamed protein product [Amoebophrya sp. A120]|eukprot:GSA120T00013827001.1